MILGGEPLRHSDGKTERVIAVALIAYALAMPLAALSRYGRCAAGLRQRLGTTKRVSRIKDTDWISCFRITTFGRVVAAIQTSI